MKKYLKILWIFSKISLQNQMAYRPSFFLAVIGKTIRMLILILMFQVIYFNTPLLADWKHEEVFLLVVTYLTIESIIVITFHRNLSYYLPDLIRKGQFDYLITKPVNSLFYSSFRVIDLMDLTSFSVVIFLWYYYFTHFAPALTFWPVIFYIIAIICALVFLFSFLVIISATAFWTINSEGIGRFFEGLIRMSRFPMDIFRGAFAVIFLYILPLGIIATLPAKIILGSVNWPYFVYAVLFTSVLFFVSIKVWRYALNHYSSASS